MWVEFVVGSLLAPRGFSPGTPVLPSPQKPTFLIFSLQYFFSAKGFVVSLLFVTKAFVIVSLLKSSVQFESEFYLSMDRRANHHNFYFLLAFF